jgi:uncharacterized membrane protein
MTRRRRFPATLAVVILLFGPAVVALFNRTAAYAVSAVSVAALVYLVLRDDPGARQ